MTAVPADPAITELRELFRNLLEFRSVFSESGTEEFPSSFGNKWSIWDLEYLYKQCERLSTRQQQAITLCLVHNMREQDAARAMGVSPTNPVMMYATLGLRKLLDMVDDGILDRFRHRRLTEMDQRERQVRALYRLADQIKAAIHITPRHDCWLYPTPRARVATKLCIPSAYSSSGFVVVSPMVVMYQAHVGALPRDVRIVHPEFGRSPLACVNFEHGVLEVTEEARVRQQKLLRYYQSRRPAGRSAS